MTDIIPSSDEDIVKDIIKYIGQSEQSVLSLLQTSKQGDVEEQRAFTALIDDKNVIQVLVRGNTVQFMLLNEDVVEDLNFMNNIGGC